MNNSTENIDDSINEAIRGVVIALSEYVKKDSSPYPIIKRAPLREIIEKHNHNDVLLKGSLAFAKDTLDSVIKDVNIENLSVKNFVESNCSKGIGIIRRRSFTAENKKFDPKEIVMPPLENIALKYRYNNDKETYD